MNPETDLADIFEKTLKIEDESPNSERGNYNVLANRGKIVKSRQERKEEEEKRLALLQIKINDLTHAIETLKIGKEKRKIHEIDNESENSRTTKRKTLRSIPENGVRRSLKSTTKKNTKKNTMKKGIIVID
jgi:hypothetical protein